MHPQEAGELVSVIVPAYNSARFLPDAIGSLMQQTHPSVEIIIVNDGSTDDTESALRPFLDSITVCHQKNAGTAAARNHGLAVSRGAFIAFLDADDAWEPEKLSRQVALLQADAAAVLIHTNVGYVDAGGRSIANVPRTDDRFADASVQALLAHNFITASSVMVRRESLEAAPFSNDVPGCEDWDLWLRLSRSGSIAFIPDRLTRYRLHGSNISSNSELMLRSSVTVLERFHASEPDAAVARTAARHLRAAQIALAHHLYESGRLDEGRTLFWRAASGLGPPELRRLFVTSLPPALRDWAWARRHGGG
jgi:glycosyltransferase involved in cell wall biosynthesis